MVWTGCSSFFLVIYQAQQDLIWNELPFSVILSLGLLLQTDVEQTFEDNPQLLAIFVHLALILELEAVELLQSFLDLVLPFKSFFCKNMPKASDFSLCQFHFFFVQLYAFSWYCFSSSFTRSSWFFPPSSSVTFSPKNYIIMDSYCAW